MTVTSALVVVDMQLVAFDGKVTPPITNSIRLLDNISKLIDLCRSSMIQPIFIQTCASSGQPYAKDVHGWEIHPQLAPLAEDRIVYKCKSSAFDDTSLKEVLDEIGVNTLIVCGIWSEYCVASTSLDAAELGFEVYVASDGHGTVSNDDDDTNDIIARQNDRLSKQGISILTIDEMQRKFSMG
jgi:nicotinamidase-related amidase